MENENTVSQKLERIDSAITRMRVKTDTSGDVIEDVASAVENLVDPPTGNINITNTNSTDVSSYATAQVVDANLSAGNIKKDVSILGVTGSYEGSGGATDVYRVETIQERDAIQNPQEDDICIVYEDASSGVQADTPFSSITCPDVVILPSEIEEFSIDQSGLMAYGSTSSFSLDYMGSSEFYRQYYTSEDGITFIKDKEMSEPAEGDLTFSSPVTITSANYNEALQFFMITGSINFSGIYTYTNSEWRNLNVGLPLNGEDIATGKSGFGNSGTVEGTLFTKDALKVSLQKSNSFISNFSTISNQTTDLSKFFINGPSDIFPTYVSQIRTGAATTLAGMFSHCSYNQNLDLSHFDTSNVTDMSDMFEWCMTIPSISLGDWDTSKVTTFAGMFYHCDQLTSLDLHKWDTSSCTTMRAMFANAYRLSSIDVSGFDTTKVTDMAHMFSGYNSNNTSLTTLDLSNFYTPALTTTQSMFSRLKGLTRLDIRNMTFDNVTNSTDMFGSSATYGVPNNCLVIVKDAAAKSFIQTACSRLTNVKTVSEL